MSQRKLSGNASNRTDGDTDEKCDAAVMAAVRAVGKHCAGGGVPVQLSNDEVLVVPEETAEEIHAVEDEDLTDREVARLIDNHEVLEEWAERQAETAGLEPGTREFDTARVAFVRQLLG